MNNIEKSYKKLPPFKGWVLQNFPFIEEDFDALTNYQMMCKVIEYLKVIQNNVDYIQDEEITPLYNAFVELKKYVDNYFDNLDIQEEINNKLDEMAESGQLADIIAQYLQVNSVLGFDTKATLKSAENLVNGSITRTLGTDTYNDGKGNYYKIRTLTSGDIIDDDNILALANYSTLIAEKIPDFRINQIESEIPIINNNIDLINSELTLFIGDSYGTGTTEESSTITSWIDYMISRYYPNSYKYAVNGAGFDAGSTKFINLLNQAISEIEDLSIVKNIVVCGGFNDRNSVVSDIESAMATFITTAKQNFVNAKIYVGMIGGCSLQNTVGTGYRSNTFLKSLPVYKKCIKYGAIYLNGVEQILKNYSYFSSDGYHPNANGYSMLADGINQAIKSGSYNINEFQGFSIDNLHLNGNVSRNGNLTRIDIEGYVDFNGVATGKNITLGNINGSYLYRLINGTMCGAIPCRFHWETNTNKYYGGFGYIVVFDNGTLQLQNHLYTNTGDNDPAGIVRITGVTKLVIDYANATFPTDLC